MSSNIHSVTDLVRNLLLNFAHVLLLMVSLTVCVCTHDQQVCILQRSTCHTEEKWERLGYWITVTFMKFCMTDSRDRYRSLAKNCDK